MRWTTFGKGREAGLPQVSVLGLGCSQVGSFGNPAPDVQVRRLLARALELEVMLFDTADIYGQGDSEREIGRLLRGRRKQGFVVTKAGNGFSPAMRALLPLKPILKPVLKRRAEAKSGAAKAGTVTGRRERHMRADFSTEHLTAALDASLRRLASDHVDAFLLHSPPPGVCADPAVRAALLALEAAGKARVWGVSCDDDAGFVEAAAMPGLGMVQAPLDVYDRAAASGLVANLAGRGVGLMVREVVRLQPQLPPEAAAAAAVARPHVTCAVVGTSRLEHLERLVAACT